MFFLVLLYLSILSPVFSSAAALSPGDDQGLSTGSVSGMTNELSGFPDYAEAEKKNASPFPIPVKLAVLAVDTMAILLIIRLVVRRKKNQKNTVQVYTWIILFYLVVGLASSIPALVITKASDFWPGVFFEAVSLLLFVLSVTAALERLVWDEDGFDYWSMTGKMTRYLFKDIQWIETNSYDRYGTIAYKIHVPGRKIGFDSMSVDIQPFLQAYNAWRSARKLGSWQKAAEKEWLAEYRTHSPFRQKLDRIDGGLVMLVIGSVFGLLSIAVAAIALFIAEGDMALKLLCAFIMLCGGLYLLGIWPAIAMMDRHPKWVRQYFYKWIRIRPNPDAKEKQ